MITYYYKNIRSKKLQTLKEYKTGSWIYVESPTDDEVQELISKFKLEEGHVLDALDEDEMPRLEKENEHTYIYTRFAYVGDDTQITTAPLLFIISDSLFITISTKPLPRLNKFTEGKIEFNTTQRTKLLLQLMDQVVDQYENYLNSVSRQIKTIRSRLRVEEIRNKDFVDFVLIEDELNEFLSALTPTNAILRRILLGKYIKLYDEDEDIVEDLLLNNQQSIEGCNSSLKTITNIRESYSTIMTNKLNQVIQILTVLTVVISVPTLVASLYGMNVDLPGSNSNIAFGGILLGSILLSTVLLLIFKSKKWLQ